MEPLTEQEEAARREIDAGMTALAKLLDKDGAGSLAIPLGDEEAARSPLVGACALMDRTIRSGPSPHPGCGHVTTGRGATVFAWCHGLYCADCVAVGDFPEIPAYMQCAFCENLAHNMRGLDISFGITRIVVPFCDRHQEATP